MDGADRVMLQISRAHYPITTLGPGRRVGIWTQGCTLACPGCISRDTWAPDGGWSADVSDLIEWVEAEAPEADGITITGGEPFQQPEALAALLDGLRDMRPDRDILAYSGYTLPWLQRRRAEVLAKLDAVISAPFREGQPTDLVWRGSGNQPLTPLSALGRRRFAPYVDATRDQPEMQFRISGETVWIVGIPPRGALDRVVAACASEGVAFKEVSWSA